MRPVYSEFAIHKDLPAGITVGAPAAGKMEALWTYTVPRNTALKIRPEDILAAYLKDAGAETIASDRVQLTIEDNAGYIKETIFEGTYEQLKTFDDRNKTKKLGLVRYVASDFNVVFYVKATTIVVPASCRFLISCKRRMLVA